MKHPFALAAMLMAVSSTASAGTVLTDGSTTAWIGSRNYLYLQKADGNAMYLQAAVIDLIGLNSQTLYCVAEDGRTYGVQLDGTSSYPVASVPDDALLKGWSLNGSHLSITHGTQSRPISLSAMYAGQAGDLLYYLEENSDGTSRLFSCSLNTDAKPSSVAQLSYHPVEMTVTTSGAAFVSPSGSVTIVTLPYAQVINLPAISGETVSAMYKNRVLYRFRAAAEGGYLLESEENITP